MSRLRLAWLRWKYILVRDSGALSIDPRWYIETGTLSRFWHRWNAQPKGYSPK